MFSRPSGHSGVHTMILSKNIHNVNKTDSVWFEFLWIRRYLQRLKSQIHT